LAQSVSILTPGNCLHDADQLLMLAEDGCQ